MNAFASAALAPIRLGVSALTYTGRAFASGAAMIFGRARSWGVYLARTRINYRAEIGDPANNSIVGAVVGWIARNFPEAPVRIVVEGTTEPAYQPSPTGPGFMLRLLERPNPEYSGVLMWNATIVDWVVGNAYWIKERWPADAGFPLAGRVRHLWWVPERLMEPRWPEDDPTVFIGWYDYSLDGEVTRVARRDVVHFRNGIDPRNTRKGLSRLGSLFREIFTDEEAANFTASLLRNLGVPGVVIAPSNTVGSGIGGKDPEATAGAIKQKWMDTFGGDRRGEPAVFTAPTDVKVLSFNPQQMELKALRRIPEERVSAVLGVPAGVAQLGAGLDRNTFTNYGEANVAAYTQGVIPAHRLMAAELEIQLLPEFVDIDKEALDVWFDWTRASAMQAATDAIWRRLESSATKGLITRADFIRGVGRTPARDGSDDVFIYPNNYAVVPVGGNPPGGRTPFAPVEPAANAVNGNGHHDLIGAAA